MILEIGLWWFLVIVMDLNLKKNSVRVTSVCVSEKASPFVSEILEIFGFKSIYISQKISTQHLSKGKKGKLLEVKNGGNFGSQFQENKLSKF